MHVQLDTQRVKKLTRHIRDTLDLDDKRGRKLADALASGLGYKSYGALKAALDQEDRRRKAIDDLPDELRQLLKRHPGPWSPRHTPDTGALRVNDSRAHAVRTYGTAPSPDDRREAYEICRMVNDALRRDDLTARGLTSNDALDLLQCEGHAVCTIAASDVALLLSHREGGDGEASDDQMDRAADWLQAHRRELEDGLARRATNVLDDALDAMPPAPPSDLEGDGSQPAGLEAHGVCIQVRQIVPDQQLDPNDRAERPEGSYLVKLADAQNADQRTLDLFHAQVPLSRPEHYAITLRIVETADFPPMQNDTVTAVAWQLVDADGQSVHGEPEDPLGLTVHQLLTQDAADQVRRIAKRDDLRLVPIALNQVAKPELIDRFDDL